MDRIAARDGTGLRNYLAWLLGAAKGYGVKLVNPGGVELWKQNAPGNVEHLDSLIPPYQVTPRAIIRQLAAAADDLRLPHAVHIHANHLGLPGNWRTTLESMRALEGHRGHMTHIQFHSYGGGGGDEATFCSRTAPLAEFVNQNPNLSVDVGQVLFGETISMTADSPLGHYLSRVYRTPWFCAHTELESGCGIAPIRYRNQSLIHAWQWAIGLEWYLLVQDPWRVAMSTDHPNGGSFLAYPQIIRLLMDRSYRDAVLQTVHRTVRERSLLSQLDREYSLGEIAIITRAGPARILGLSHKGHLGPGADADVTIYAPHENRERMFQIPKYVIKSGCLLVDNFELQQAPFGKTLFVHPAFDREFEPRIAEWFNENYSIRFRNYALAEGELRHAEQVACGPPLASSESDSRENPATD
jgi:formylmethanofuran dehydrogenase subunit A